MPTPAKLATGVFALCMLLPSTLVLGNTAAPGPQRHQLHQMPGQHTHGSQRMDEGIVWAIDIVPPAFYLEDGQLSGFGSDAVNWFINSIGHHTIKVLPLPRGRAFEVMHHANMSGDHTVCIPGVLETPQRARDFILSKPVFSQLPVSLIIKADREPEFAPFLTNAGEIDLARLLRNDRFYAALEAGRSYGLIVDDILRPHESGTHIQKTRQTAEFTTMLELQRIDWFLAYPIEAEHQRKSANQDAMIKSLPIAGMPETLDARIACSITDTGRHLVEHTDAIIADFPEMPWAEGYIELLSPDDAKRYRALILKRQASQ